MELLTGWPGQGSMNLPVSQRRQLGLRASYRVGRVWPCYEDQVPEPVPNSAFGPLLLFGFALRSFSGSLSLVADFLASFSLGASQAWRAAATTEASLRCRAKSSYGIL